MEEKSRKTALRMLSYGVYVLTSKFEVNYCAATVTWVSQASFEPPLITVCIKRESQTYSVVKNRGEFILHLLGEDQKDIAAVFFKSSLVENNQINGEAFNLENDLPILAEPPSYLNCKVVEIFENGDHPLFLAEVCDAVVLRESKPLELRKTGWSYGG